MHKLNILLVLLLLLVSGCVTTQEKKRAVGSVDLYWQSANDSFMAEHGQRHYPVSRTQAYAAILTTFARMNLIVVNQDPSAGLVLGSAPAPLPLSATEWQQVVTAETPDLRRIVAGEVGYLERHYQLDPVGKDTLVNVFVADMGEGVDVSISFRLQTQQQNGEPVRTQAPPTAVVLGISKFWRYLDESLRHTLAMEQVVRQEEVQKERTLETEKRVCLSMTDGEFTLNDARSQLLSRAKAEAVSEFFGEQVSARSEVTNFVLTDDQIRSETGGIVRLKGKPQFYNGTSLGEVCMDARFYITQSDLAKLEPRQMSERDLCYAGEQQSLEHIRQAYPGAAISRVLQRTHPQLTGQDQRNLLGLARNLRIRNEKVVSSNVICADIHFEVIPLELEIYERFRSNG